MLHANNETLGLHIVFGAQTVSAGTQIASDVDYGYRSVHKSADG